MSQLCSAPLTPLFDLSFFALPFPTLTLFLFFSSLLFFFDGEDVPFASNGGSSLFYAARCSKPLFFIGKYPFFSLFRVPVRYDYPLATDNYFFFW